MSKDNILDELILAAKKGQWNYIDNFLPKLKQLPDTEEFIDWACNTTSGFRDNDDNMKELAAKLVEYLPVSDDVYKEIMPVVAGALESESQYVAQRAAFALAAHGPGNYRPEVMLVLEKALGDKEVSHIAEGYLEQLSKTK